MPLYEFRCPQGHDFEKFYRSIGAAVAEEKCPECGVVAARLMSTAGLVFKGSGFYITDYGKDGKKAERDAATAKAASPKTEAASGGDAKPAEAAPKAAESAPAAAAKAPEAKPAPAPAKAAASSKKAE
jgi:putative FmdB family regulatory protein